MAKYLLGLLGIFLTLVGILNNLIRLLAAPAAPFLEWAVYGLFVLPALKRAVQGS